MNAYAIKQRLNFGEQTRVDGGPVTSSRCASFYQHTFHRRGWMVGGPAFLAAQARGGNMNRISHLWRQPVARVVVIVLLLALLLSMGVSIVGSSRSAHAASAGSGHGPQKLPACLCDYDGKHELHQLDRQSQRAFYQCCRRAVRPGNQLFWHYPPQSAQLYCRDLRLDKRCQQR